MAAVSILVAGVIGFSLVTLLLAGRGTVLLRVALGAGVGLGVTSCIFFIQLVTAGVSLTWLVPAEVVIGLVLLGVQFGAKLRVQEAPSAASAPSALHKLLVVLFCAAAALGAFAFIYDTARNPHGVWDAWSIWNLRARFIFAGGDQWRDAFSPLIGWSHPDYPLLLPGSVVRCWEYAGREAVLAPAAVAGVFTLAALALLASSVAALRGKSQGLLAGLVLLAAPGFVALGASQTADVPLAFCILATVVLLSLHDRGLAGGWKALVLAGLAAGLSGWTKNEGLVFIVAICVARFGGVLFARGLRTCLREAGAFALGLAGVLAVIVWFKLTLASPNDIVSAAGSAGASQKLADLSRYGTVLQGMVLSHVAKWVAPPLAVYLLCVGLRGDARDRLGVATSAVALLLMLACYALAYVVTPNELTWHLKASVNRLLLGLWPAALFCFFLLVRSPEEVLASRSPETPRELA